jgi:hypothetical protein
MDGVKIEVDAWGLTLEQDVLDEIWEVFNDVELAGHFHKHVVVLARDAEGDIIGAVTGNDELSLAVCEDRQQEGIGTEMIRQLLAANGGGFMVAGTEAGAAFLSSLLHNLTEGHDALDVPMWESMGQGV